MAEPTEEQKLEAANAALAELDISDADEAKRAVAIFWSQVPLLPQPEQVPDPEPDPEPARFVPAYFGALISAGEEAPELKGRIEALNKEAMAITKLLANRDDPAEDPAAGPAEDPAEEVK